MLLALMTLGAIALNINFVSGTYNREIADHAETGVVYGFPLPWMEIGTSTQFAAEDSREVVMQTNHFRIRWVVAGFNLAITGSIIILSASLLESHLRRGWRRIPKSVFVRGRAKTSG